MDNLTIIDISEVAKSLIFLSHGKELKGKHLKSFEVNISDDILSDIPDFKKRMEKRKW